MIALLADIHGDAEAIDMILSRLPSEVDRVIVLGDVLGGRRDAEVVSRLAQIGAECLLGHVEASALGLWSERGEDPVRVDPMTKKTISAWPMQIADAAGTFVHGSARHPFRTDDGSIESARLEWSHTDAAVLFRAHAHNPSLMALQDDVIIASPIVWGRDIILSEQARWIVTLPAVIRTSPANGWALWDPTHRVMQFHPLA